MGCVTTRGNEALFAFPAKIGYAWYMSKDLVDLAISMTEMDTGIELSPQEREEMLLSILAKIEDTNR